MMMRRDYHEPTVNIVLNCLPCIICPKTQPASALSFVKEEGEQHKGAAMLCTGDALLDSG